MTTAGYLVLPLYLLVPWMMVACVATWRRRRDADAPNRVTATELLVGSVVAYACMVLALILNEWFRHARLLEAVPHIRSAVEIVFPLLAFAGIVGALQVSLRLFTLFLAAVSARVLGSTWYAIRGHWLGIDVRFAVPGDPRREPAFRTHDGRARLFIYELGERGTTRQLSLSPEACAEHVAMHFTGFGADCWSCVHSQSRMAGGVQLLKFVFAEQGTGVQAVNDVVIARAGVLLVRTYFDADAMGGDVVGPGKRAWLRYRPPWRLPLPL